MSKIIIKGMVNARDAFFGSSRFGRVLPGRFCPFSSCLAWARFYFWFMEVPAGLLRVVSCALLLMMFFFLALLKWLAAALHGATFALV